MRRLLIALFVLALLLTGCQQATQKLVEQQTGVQVSQKGDAVTVKSKEGDTTTVNSSQVPDALKSIPLPQGFALAQGGAIFSSSKTGEMMASAVYQGKGTVQAASDYYKKIMVDQGWTKTFVQETGDASQQGYTKGLDQAMIILGKDSQDVTLQIVITNASK